MARLHSFFCAYALLFVLVQLTVTGNAPLRIRQDGNPAVDSTSAQSASAVTIGNADSSIAQTSQGLTTTFTTAPSTMMTSVSIMDSTTSNASIPASSTAANGTTIDSQTNPGVIIQVTPALGIVGAILLLTGLAYTFIGVRHRLTHVFFSTAYLVALAIVILVVYVCNPPVSNAVQGAYLIAALLPGCILGGLAIIFKDIVEGLGCLLGGFCLGMWFMTLKDNGLIESQGGRIGLICGMAGAALFLSFSHHTRHYGLLACISFGGATVIVLGIDCFSKAGLKEFWLYVWDLNPNLLIFPQHMKDYRVTRGIKVETVAIVILAVLGAMSQMKLWVVVQKRRREREAKRRLDAEDREQQDALRANELEEARKRDMAGWEQTYDGAKVAADASVSNFTTSTNHDSTYHSQAPSQKRTSISVREIKDPAAPIEMTEFVPSSRQTSHTGPASLRNSKDKSSIRESQTELSQAQPRESFHKNEAALKALETGSSGLSRNASRKSYVVRGDNDEGHWEDTSTEKPAPPELTPLPFKVTSTTENKVKDGEDDLESLATVGETVQDVDNVAEPQRVSQARSTRRSSIGTNADSNHDSEEQGPGLVIPHVDDDRSSVAATLDGLTDADLSSLPKLSRPTSPVQNVEEQAVSSEMNAHLRRPSAASVKEVPVDKEGNVSVAIPEPMSMRSESLSEHPKTSPSSLLDSPEQEGASNAGATDAGARTAKRPSLDSSGGESSGNRAGLTKDALPEGQSQTVHLFRTNEWAKHQAVAEKPMADEVAPPSESGVSVLYGAEATAPVNVAELQQDAFTQQPPAMSRNASTASNNPHREPSSAALSRSNTNQSMTTLRQKTQASSNAFNLSRNSSTASIQQQNSQALRRQPSNSRNNVAHGSHAQPPTLRSSSTNLLNQPLAENPGEDTSDPRSVSSHNLSPSNTVGSSTPNLLDRRQELLRGRQSAMSFANPDALGTAALSSNTNLANIQASPASTSPTATTDTNNTFPSSSKQKLMSAPFAADEESMTLAQRRDLIQRSQSQAKQNNPRQQQPSASAVSRAPSQQYRSPINRQTSWIGPAAQQPHIYNSHAPQRGPSITAAQREQRMASWRGDLGGSSLQRQSSLGLGGGGGVAGTSAPHVNSEIDDSRARMLDEQKSRGLKAEQRAWQGQMRAHEIDQRMRDGTMLDLHRERLRAMERKTGAGNA